MNIISKALTFIAFTCAPLAQAERSFDYARVTHVNPVYQTVQHRVPREECWYETVRVEQPHHHSATGTLMGGVVGGALGHAVGHGKKNKKIGAVVGSIVGMSVGNDISRRNRGHQAARYEEFERCETRYSTEVEERLTGYDVTYEYFGSRYTTHTRHHPGKRIKVAVDVRPVSAN